MELGEHARRGVAWSTLAAGGSALFSLGQVAVAARHLERADFGLMALVMLVIGFSEKLADAGLAGAVLHRQQASRAELSSVFWLSTGVGLVLCGGVALCAPLFAALWSEPALTGWLRLAGCVFVASGLGNVSAALLRRELRYGVSGAVDLASSVVSFAVVVWLAVSGYGVLALVAGLLAGAAARCVLALACARDVFVPTLHFRRSDLVGWLEFGSWQVGERLVNFASWNVDRMVIGLVLGTEALGVYSLAYQLMIRPFQLVSGVAGRVVRPLLGRLQRDRERVLGAFFTGLKLVALAVVPVYVGAFLLAEPLVALVYGPGSADVAAIFRILCPLGILYALGNSDGALVVATGKARVTFLWNCCAAVVHGVAVAVGVGFGLAGVAGAIVLATLALLLPAFYVRWLLIRMPVRPYLASLARPFLYGAVMGAGVRVVAASLDGVQERLQLALLVGAGVAIYGSLIWLRERALLLELRGSS